LRRAGNLSPPPPRQIPGSKQATGSHRESLEEGRHAAGKQLMGQWRQREVLRDLKREVDMIGPAVLTADMISQAVLTVDIKSQIVTYCGHN